MKRTKLKDLDVGQRQQLASIVESSEATIRQIAQGSRKPSSAMAIKIEKAADKMGLTINRSDLAAGCATCEYARECEKARGRR